MFDNYVGPVWTGAGGVCTYYTGEQDKCTFYPATSGSGVPYQLAVDSNYSQVAAGSCPEQADGAPVAAVVAAHCKKPGSGLEAESQVLVWRIIDSTRNETSSGEAPLSLGANDELKRIFLINGRIFASFDTEKGITRAGIGSNGITWTVIAETEKYDDEADPSIILPGPEDCVILPGKSATNWQWLNPTTGAVLKSVDLGETLYAIHDQTADYFINSFWSSTDGYFMMLHRKKDGSLINKSRCRSIEIDHTKNRAVLIYASDSSASPSPAPSSAGLEIMDLSNEEILYKLTRSSISSLGGADALSMLDNHLMLSTGEGIKLVLADTGKNDPNSPDIPNHTRSMTNTVRGSGQRWALLSGTNDEGDYPMMAQYLGIVTKSDSLSWTDIPSFKSF